MARGAFRTWTRSRGRLHPSSMADSPSPSAAWTGRSTLVTGGATGIGAAAAVGLAARGVPVTVATLRPGEGAEEARSSAGSSPPARRWSGPSTP